MDTLPLSVAIQQPTIDDIDRRRREIVDKFYEFKQSLQARKSKLEATKQFIQFKRLVNELMTWVSDKFDILKEQFLDDSSNILIRKQKLLAFEVEIAAHKDVLSRLFLLYSEMEEDENFVLGNAKEMYKTAEGRYNELQTACQVRNDELKNLSEKQQFIMEVNEILGSIGHKLAELQSRNFGITLDEVCELQSKFESFSKSLSTDKARCDLLIQQGRLMLSSNHSDSDAINSMVEELSTQWENLEELTRERQICLDVSHEVYFYIDQTQEIQSWIADKVIVLSNEDVGKNLASSEALLRHHMIFVRDLVVIEERVKHLDSEASNLIKKHSKYVDILLTAQADLISCWEGLRKSAAKRGLVLSDSQKVHKLLSDTSDILAWISDMKHLIECDSAPTTLSDANTLLERILEYEGELCAREESFLNTIAFGNSLIASEHSQIPLINEAIESIQIHTQSLKEILLTNRRDLDQLICLLRYFQHCTHTENLLSRMLEDIVCNISGNTWEETDSLIKRLQNYDRTFHAYCDDICNLRIEADTLKNIFPENDLVGKNVSNLDGMKVNLSNILSDNAASLLSMRDLHEFHRELIDLREWIEEQTFHISQNQTADIEHTLQMHIVLVNEVSINSQRIEDFILRGQNIESPANFNIKDIVLGITELSTEWGALNALCNRKHVSLIDDCSLIQYSVELEKILSWVHKTELFCKSQDLGKDMNSASKIQKHLRILDHDVSSNTQRFDNLVSKVADFHHREHDSLSILQENVHETRTKLSVIPPLYRQRCEAVDQSCFTYKLLMQIQDEQDWVEEKSKLILSCNSTNELIHAQKLLKRFELLVADFQLREDRVISLQIEFDPISSHPHSSICVHSFGALKNKWANLRDLSLTKNTYILNNISIQQYFCNCFETEIWLKEKDTLLSSGNVAKDEDSALLLIHKLEALYDELKLFSQSIDELLRANESLVLNPNASNFVDRVVSSPSTFTNTRDCVRCTYDYTARRPQELTIQRGDNLILISSTNDDWWKVKNSTSQIGYVPSNYLERILQDNSETSDISVPMHKQTEINNLYQRVLRNSQERLNQLVSLYEHFCLEREIQEIFIWLREANSLGATIDNQSSDHESTTRSRLLFEELLTQVWSYETRILLLVENKNSRTSVGCESLLDDLFIEWKHLLSSMDSRKQVLSDLFNLQMLILDIEDVIAWINDVDISTSSELICRDLASVQLYLRDHEMLDNSRSAIQSKLKSFHASSVQETISQSSNILQPKLDEMTNLFDLFSKNLIKRAGYLEDSHYYYRFLTEQRDLLSWISSLKGQFSVCELSFEISGAEALLMRIEELIIEIIAREDNVLSLHGFGTKLIQERHISTQEISSRLEELNNAWLDLKNVSDAQQLKVNQLLDLLVYLRDVDQFQSWIVSKRQFVLNVVSNFSPEGIQNTLRIFDELQNAILLQEVKILVLQESANKLIQSRHYASAEIAEKRVDILNNWNILKSSLSEKRENILSVYSLHQFILDIGDIDKWISEKMQYFGALSEKATTTNSIVILSKTYETSNSEVATHGERITSVFEIGHNLLENSPSQEQSQTITNKINSLQGNWELLLSMIEDREMQLNIVKDESDFSLAYRSKINWIEETIILMVQQEKTYDIEYAESVIDGLQHIKIELHLRKSQIDELIDFAHELIQRKYSNVKIVSDMSNKLKSRFDESVNLLSLRDLELQKDLHIFKFLRSLENEQSWLHDSILLNSVQDYGKDLIGVQRLRKKHQRFQSALAFHENLFLGLQSQALSMDVLQNDGQYFIIIQEKFDLIRSSLKELQLVSESRTSMLNQSESYQKFIANIQEEESWLTDMVILFSNMHTDKNIEGFQENYFQLEVFASDYQAHHEWIAELTHIGDKLVLDGNVNSASIKVSCLSILSRLRDLEERYIRVKERYNTSKAIQDYSHRIDLVDSWISLREFDIQSIDYGEGNVISYIESLITKHSILENTLDIFQNDGINKLLIEKNRLEALYNAKVPDVITKCLEIENRWNRLLKNSEERKFRLLRSLELSKKVDDLFLDFAQKASSFYSWLEDAKEDLVEPVKCSSIEEIDLLRNNDVQFQTTVSWAHGELKILYALDRQINSFATLSNPYTWYTTDSLQESWNELQAILIKRQADLTAERTRQEKNDKLKRLFAEKANAFSMWLVNTRKAMIENTGQLQDQLDFLLHKLDNIQQRQQDLSSIESLSSDLQNEMILDNSYTQHSTVLLTQQWHQLSQLGRRMVHNCQQQLMSKNLTGVSEEDMKEFQTLFNVYDKDHSGQLEEAEFKSCLISLGYSLQFMEKEQKDSEYENILDQVDPQRLGYVSLEDFMSFHISRRTEKVKSREELEDAFRSITTDENSNFVTKDELQKALGTELQCFCLQHMDQLPTNPNCFDYLTFTRSLFMS